MKSLIETFTAEQKTQFESPEVRQCWHKGRMRYAIWMLTPPHNVVTQIQALQKKLESWIIPLSSPHITLCACGFPAQNPQYSDDVSDKELKEQEHRLNNLNPFNVETYGVSSFLNGPIVLIKPNSELMNLRALLTLENPDFREVSYTPHLSLGLYKRPYKTSMVAKQLNALPPLRPISWCTHSAELAEFEASDPTARLHIKKSITFTKKRPT